MARSVADVMVRVFADTRRSRRQVVGDLENAGGQAGTSAGRRFRRGFDQQAAGAGGTAARNMGRGDPGGKAGKHAGGRFKGAFSSATKSIGASLVASFSIGAGITLFKGMIDEANEAAVTTAQTNAVIKSTKGAAKVSADHVAGLANKLSLLSGKDDEYIQKGANMLLTFTNIRNGVGKNNKIFDEATRVTLDMSSALGIDMSKASIQVGKALNDPVKGITALRRVGVTFTDGQKKQIASLVKQGKTMDAQKIILKELNKEFGGSAKAQATPAEKAKVAWANFKEQLGTEMLPMLNRLLGVLVKKLLPAVLKGVEWVRKFMKENHQTAIVIGAGIGLIAALAAVIWLVNIAMAANPAILIAIAVVALAAAVVYCYFHFKKFRGIVDSVWRGMLAAWNWMKGPFVNFFTTTMPSAFVAAWHGVYNGFLGPIKNFFTKTIPHIFSYPIDFLKKNWMLIVGALLGPVGIAVALIYRFWGPIKTLFTQTIPSWAGFLVGKIKGLWTDMQIGIGIVWGRAKQWVIYPIRDFFTKTIPGWAGTLTGAIKGLWTDWQIGVGIVWGRVKQWVLYPIRDFFTKTIPGWAGTLTGAIKRLWTDWQIGVGIVWGKVKQWVLYPIRDFFTKTIPGWAGTLAGAIKRLWTDWQIGVGIVWGKVKQWVLYPIRDFFTRTIPSWAGTLAGAIKRLWTDWQIGVGIVWGKVKQWVLYPIRDFFTRTIPGWTGTLAGAIKRLWADWYGGVLTVWGKVKGRVLYPIRDFFTKTIPSWTGTLVGKVKGLWNDMASGLGKAWDRIKGMAKGPIIFVLETVLKNGLFSAWNAIAGLIGGPKATGLQADLGKLIGQIKSKHAGGGKIYGPGTDTSDSIVARLSRDEFVVRAKAARSIGYDALYAMNRTGRLPGHATGGVAGEPDTGQYKRDPKTGSDRIGASANIARIGLGGGPSSVPYIVALAKKSKVPFRVTSTTRPGSRSTSGNLDYHSQGLAVDMASSTQGMNQLAQFFLGYGGYLLELIHSPSWFVKNGKRVGKSFYGAEVPLHYDHVHVAATAAAMQRALKLGPSESLGYIGEFVVDVAGKFKKFKDMLSKLQKGTKYEQLIASGGMKIIAQAIKKGTSLAEAFGGSGGGFSGTAKGPLQSYAKSLLSHYGWGEDQLGPLIKLWEGESGWNPRAKNPSSGAYGIPQALPAVKMASAGSDYYTNGKTQIRWGLGYIKSVYGSPARAYSTWLARSPHWYAQGGRVTFAKMDQGGWLAPGLNLVENNLGRPERVPGPGGDRPPLVQVFLGNEEFTDRVKVVVDGQLQTAAATAQRGRILPTGDL